MKLFDLMSVLCDCTTATICNRYFEYDTRHEKLATITNDSLEIHVAKCHSDNDSLYNITDLLNRKVVNFSADEQDMITVYTEKDK